MTISAVRSLCAPFVPPSVSDANPTECMLTAGGDEHSST
jgi:hypothetical protein